jgi:hypothetical protein
LQGGLASGRRQARRAVLGPRQSGRLCPRLPPVAGC